MTIDWLSVCLIFLSEKAMESSKLPNLTFWDFLWNIQGKSDGKTDAQWFDVYIFLFSTLTKVEIYIMMMWRFGIKVKALRPTEKSSQA